MAQITKQQWAELYTGFSGIYLTAAECFSNTFTMWESVCPSQCVTGTEIDSALCDLITFLDGNPS